MMIIYHAVYDLETFYGWNIGVLTGGWWLFARTTAVLFLLLVGISFAISWNRRKKNLAGASFQHLYFKYLLRGLGLFACGMLVSLVTWFLDSSTFVRFGILHMIGVSILLIPFFARLKEWNLVTGTLIIIAGQWMPPLRFESVDYWPLLPWFGVVLMGFSIGYFVYVRFARHRRPEGLRPKENWMTWPGRHALLIYLIHQPLILGFLGLLGFPFRV